MTTLIAPPQNGTVTKDRTVVRMDTSQLVQYLKCPTFHNYVSVQNLIHKYADRQALDRGTVMHGLLERYYTKIWERDTPSSAMNYALGCLNELKAQVSLQDDDYVRLAKRFVDYFVKYSQESVKVETIKTPQGDKPAIELGFSVPLLDNENFYFVLEGRIDMITLFDDKHVVWDHKAQGRQYSLFSMSLQALNYLLASGNNTFMHNYVRLHEKVLPGTFQRESRFVSSSTLARWKHKLIDYFHRIAIGSIGDDFPNQSCSDIGFGRICPYTQLCSEDRPGVKAAFIQRDFVIKKQWEPWSLEELVGGEAE